MEADVHYLVPETRPVPSAWLRPAPIAHPIAGGEGTGTPVQELSVDLDKLVPSEWLRPAPIARPIAGGDGTGTPQQELSVDLDELALAQTEQFYLPVEQEILSCL